jgi:hypothetical protein
MIFPRTEVRPTIIDFKNINQGQKHFRNSTHSIFGKKVYLAKCIWEKDAEPKKAASCQEKREGKITYDFVENC